MEEADELHLFLLSQLPLNTTFDISRAFSLYLSWTFAVLTSSVRLKQALLCTLFWSCRKNTCILFVWNFWKNLKMFFVLFCGIVVVLLWCFLCVCKRILVSCTFTVSLLQFQTQVIRMFLFPTLCRLARYKFTNVIFWVNNLQACNSNDFDWLFLTAVYDYLQRVTLNRIRYFIYSFFLSCSLSCNNTAADNKINIFPCQQEMPLSLCFLFHSSHNLLSILSWFLFVQFTLSSPQSSQVPLFWHKENSYYFTL